MFERRIGRLDEVDFLEQISPLSRADRIVRPLLIGQGRNDPRVKETESEQIVAASQTVWDEVFYIGFSRRSSAQALIPSLNQAIVDMRTEGRIEALLAGESRP